jgi:hypothetical protein
MAVPLLAFQAVVMKKFDKLVTFLTVCDCDGRRG